MLAVMGDDWIAQHILNTIKQENEQRAFRYYVTDTLYFMAHNKAPARRFSELMEETRRPPETRTAQDIKLTMLEKLNRKEV